MGPPVPTATAPSKTRTRPLTKHRQLIAPEQQHNSTPAPTNNISLLKSQNNPPTNNICLLKSQNNAPTTNIPLLKSNQVVYQMHQSDVVDYGSNLPVLKSTNNIPHPPQSFKPLTKHIPKTQPNHTPTATATSTLTAANGKIQFVKVAKVKKPAASNAKENVPKPKRPAKKKADVPVPVAAPATVPVAVASQAVPTVPAPVPVPVAAPTRQYSPMTAAYNVIASSEISEENKTVSNIIILQTLCIAHICV